MRILVAEDDQNISIIAQIALEQIGGHKVTLVSDGEAALYSALNDKFDLILLDEMMPKMSGLQVSQAYASQCQDRVPIIFLSAKSQNSDIKDFHRFGKGFIAKPFDPSTLCQCIEEILANEGEKIA